MLCVSAVNGAYSIIELSGSELSWVTSTEATKAKPQRVVIGRLSVKWVLFLVMLKRHSWRGTSFFNPHIPPFFNSVEPQWIFLNYSPLCENSRANQAWRMSSPTRTFNSRDISFVTPFLCQEIQTNCQAWRRQPDCRLHYTQHVFSQVPLWEAKRGALTWAYMTGILRDLNAILQLLCELRWQLPIWDSQGFWVVF